MTAPEIAIVAPNTLTSLGLQNLLEEIIPMATIRQITIESTYRITYPTIRTGSTRKRL